MNILHLNDKIEISGGTEVYIQNVIEYLSKINIHNFWIGVYGTYKYSISVKGTNTEIIKATLNNTIDFLSDFVNNNNIDIIHVHSISDPELLKACFKLVPVVRTMHEPRMFCPGKGKFWRNSEKVCNIPFGKHCIIHAFTQGCMNRHPKRIYSDWKNTSSEIEFSLHDYKSIIVMSHYMKFEALRVGMPENVLKLIPAFTKDEPKVEVDNQGLVRILFIGRLSRTKGVQYFIQVGLKILEKFPNIIFDIVGDGHDRNSFEALVPKKHKQNILFHGWVSQIDVNNFLKQSYIFLFTSIYPEAFGLSGIEAMMHGKPVVGFDVGGVSSWLKEGLTGFLVPVKNVEIMSEKVLYLLDNKQTYLRFREQSRKVAIQEFSPPAHIEKLKLIYLEALARVNSI